MEEFQVSKITVRHAIKELAQEGFLETGSGKRTKIVRNRVHRELVKGKRFTEWLVERGHRLEKQWIAAERIKNKLGTEQAAWFGDECIRLQRLYRLDGAPYIHLTHYITADAGEVGLPELSMRSLYEWFVEQGIQLEKFQDRFAVAAAPDEIAELLQVKANSPLLKRTRFSYDDTNRLIECSVGLYNTKLQPYHVDYS